MEVFKKSSYSTYTLASEGAQSTVLSIINKPNTLYYSTKNIIVPTGMPKLLAVLVCN